MTITEYLEKTRLSQIELAGRAQIDPATISRCAGGPDAGRPIDALSAYRIVRASDGEIAPDTLPMTDRARRAYADLVAWMEGTH